MFAKCGLFVFPVLLLTVVKCQKNILFLVADDLRPNLGAYNDANADIFKQPPMHTPNLDSLASKSLLFEKAYDVFALCNPSRTATLTSRRPDTTRITRIGPYWRDYGGNFSTLPQFFKENGYYTIGAGKIFHKGRSSNNDDCEYSWSICPFYHAPNNAHPGEKLSWVAFNKTYLDEKPLQDTLNTNYVIDKLKGAAETFKAGGAPFFISLGIHKPHLPW